MITPVGFFFPPTAGFLKIMRMIHLPPTFIRVASTLRMQGWNVNVEFVVSVSEPACSCEVREMKVTVAARSPLLPIREVGARKELDLDSECDRLV